MAEAIDGLTQGQTLAPWYMLVVTGAAQAEKAVEVARDVWHVVCKYFCY